MAPPDLSAAYDQIGHGYRAARQPDPRLAARIWAALGDAQTVLNVGAGAGSYEPTDRWVLAVEPSAVMIAQGPPGSAPVIQVPVEALPLADQSVDAAMAVLTVHHWRDLDAGIAQLRRVARKRIAIVTMDVPTLARLWIISDYLPEFVGSHTDRFPTIARLCALLPNAEAMPLPVPHDCSDQFLAALWRRPRSLLDPELRAATSPWYDLPADTVSAAPHRLERELDDGTWQRRHGEILGLDALDVGLRIVVSRTDVGSSQGSSPA